MKLISLEYIDLFDNDKKKKLEFSSNLLDKNTSLNSLFVLRVDGESMEPLVLNRSLVVADLSKKKFHKDNIFIVNIHGKFWIKKAKILGEKKMFVSINENFSHLVYDFSEVKIIARVLLTFSKL